MSGLLYLILLCNTALSGGHCDKGADGSLVQLGASVKPIEFHKKAESCYMPSRLFNEIGTGTCSAASGDQIIDNEHTLTGMNGILLDLDTGRTIFEII